VNIVSDNNWSDALQESAWYFLLRSLLIGAVIGIPGGLLFPPIWRILHFLATLSAVRIAGDFVQLAIVFTAFGLMIQALFHLVRKILRLSKSKHLGLSKG